MKGKVNLNYFLILSSVLLFEIFANPKFMSGVLDENERAFVKVGDLNIFFFTVG